MVIVRTPPVKNCRASTQKMTGEETVLHSCDAMLCGHY